MSLSESLVDEKDSETDQVAASTTGRPAWLYVLSWDIRELGGVNQVVTHLFSRTERLLQHQPVLMIRSWKHRRPLVDVIDGRRTVRVRVASPWNPARPLWNALTYTLRLPAALLTMRALLREERVRVVNVHYPDLSASSWVLLRDWLRVPLRLILSFHGMDARAAIACTGLPRKMWKMILGRADRITVCSEDLRDLLIEHFGVAPRQIAILDNGVDSNRVLTDASSRPTASGEPYIMSIGTYERKKGHDVLIRAFSRIAPRHPDMALVVAGRAGDASELERLQALCVQCGVQDRVRLLTNVEHPEVMRSLAGAALFVLASRQEPFGIAILEAGVLGKPVVATDICGAARRLDAGVDLVTVPVEDVDALVDAIERILADPKAAAEMGSSLRGRVIAEFDWDSLAAAWRTAAAG